MLTDDLWLAAYDSVNGKPRIGDWALGVGLATGLIAELIHNTVLSVERADPEGFSARGRFVDLRQGELFRNSAVAVPDDPALRAVLVQMQSEERSWLAVPRPAPAQVRAPVADQGIHEWLPPSHDGRGWPSHGHSGRDWPSAAQEGWDGSGPQVQQKTRHRERGHDLTAWLSYLAYDKRAETLVIERLARAGLAGRREQRRLFRGTTARYVPYDSVVAGTPANTITSALQLRRQLPRQQLFLAGLFLATGLHHHALATLSPVERSLLADQLGAGLTDTARELLKAADAAVGDAAMR